MFSAKNEKMIKVHEKNEQPPISQCKHDVILASQMGGQSFRLRNTGDSVLRAAGLAQKRPLRYVVRNGFLLCSNNIRIVFLDIVHSVKNLECP